MNDSLTELAATTTNCAQDFEELVAYLTTSAAEDSPLGTAARETLAEAEAWLSRRSGYVVVAGDIWSEMSRYVDDRFDMDNPEHEESWAHLFSALTDY